MRRLRIREVPSAGNKSDRQEPGCSANDAFAVICSFNQTPFSLDKLGNVANEGENFAHTLVKNGDSCQQVEKRSTGGLGCFQVGDGWRRKTNFETPPICDWKQRHERVKGKRE